MAALSIYLESHTCHNKPGRGGAVAATVGTCKDRQISEIHSKSRTATAMILCRLSVYLIIMIILVGLRLEWVTVL